MGGPRATQQFARLFMFPTVYHCGGGYANSSFDLVYPMVQWVEDGTAPSQITATDTIGNATLTRPVYPYPDIPKYDGSGNVDQATSFQPAASPGAHYTNWIGNYLFRQPIGGERRTETRSRRAHA
jgi:feruloyl esterase